ncbi:hypothetical protein V494_08344 [Pseudogymnoascus sp. VKM F-4513 (FW-928)]|nr:hypothetical protein V494_08344 [Pseudogymnoascus sp. VKM F-4513 (FW-928)]
MQVEIIYRANAKDSLPWERLTDTIHERAARGAEVVLATAHVRQVRVQDGEIGSEHGRRDLAAIGTVTEEGVDEAGGFSREGELDGAAEAGCCRGIVLGPAIVGTAGKREVGLGFIGGGRHGGVFLYWAAVE